MRILDNLKQFRENRASSLNNTNKQKEDILNKAGLWNVNAVDLIFARPSTGVIEIITWKAVSENITESKLSTHSLRFELIEKIYIHAARRENYATTALINFLDCRAPSERWTDFPLVSISVRKILTGLLSAG